MNLPPYLGFVFTAQLLHMHQLGYEITHHTLARIKALPVYFLVPPSETMQDFSLYIACSIKS
jgi:hypothetical protein